jgi:hypothetical protein
MPEIVTRYPHFVLNSVSSATPAWDCPNPWELRKPAPKRHRNLLVPRSNGQLARGMWFDQAERDLIVNVFDGTSPDGGAAALDENVAALEAAWYADPGGDSTRTITLNLTASVAYSGAVQVMAFDWREKSPVLIRAVLTVCIPAGHLELVP